VTKLLIGWPGNRGLIASGERVFSSVKCPDGLRGTLSPFCCVSETVSSKVMLTGFESDDANLVSRLRMCGVIFVLSHVPSLSKNRQLFYFLNICHTFRASFKQYALVGRFAVLRLLTIKICCTFRPFLGHHKEGKRYKRFIYRHLAVQLVCVPT
jgi:predicted neutral ceramidase superfamily lipid hydrolase